MFVKFLYWEHFVKMSRIISMHYCTLSTLLYKDGPVLQVFFDRVLVFKLLIILVLLVEVVCQTRDLFL